MAAGDGCHFLYVCHIFFLAESILDHRHTANDINLQKSQCTEELGVSCTFVSQELVKARCHEVRGPRGPGHLALFMCELDLESDVVRRMLLRFALTTFASI